METNRVTQRTQMSDLARLSATVYGRVQGVCFRYFVLLEARKLDLRGYVRNCVSGDAVEVRAEGEKPRLDELLERLEVGPSEARVKRVEADWSDYSGRFANFTVRYY